MYINTSNNIERTVETRHERYVRRENNNSTSTRRRYRSRSSERTHQSRNNNKSMRIWGSHLTEQQRAEFEKEHVEQERIRTSSQSVFIPQPPTPPTQILHTNADELISRLVRDNHSLYDAIRQRDNTIINLQNEIDRLRRGRNI